MNNTTIKRFDLTIKLRGDNIYDIYCNEKWIASGGNCEHVLDEAKNFIKKSLLEE